MIEFLKYLIPLSIIINTLGILSTYSVVIILCLIMRMPVTDPKEFFQITYDSNMLTVILVVGTVLAIIFSILYKLGVK